MFKQTLAGCLKIRTNCFGEVRIYAGIIYYLTSVYACEHKH